jgi:lipopolysaccharide/colanic/teichoic acid biosynthesis glycosyltransferase
VKRLFDIVFALIGLIAISPICLIAAIAIRLSSAGPIFYHAERIGKDRKPFRMLKFRTMHVNSGGPVITALGDSRIFPIGSFLRTLKIDELPQLLNVLSGEMSIVGPRPEDPSVVSAHYTSWMLETLRVRPGITSPGAVYYYTQGEKLVDHANPEVSYVDRLLGPKLAIERAYMEHPSFWGDILVIAKTLLAIVAAAVGAHPNLSKREIAEALRWVPEKTYQADLK